MYSNAQKGNKQETKPSIFDIAQKVRKQSEGRNEALQILNAYRKVQDLSVPSNNLSRKQKESKHQNRRPQSQYANKVKQTLKQMNANRKKQIQSIKLIQKPIINQKINGIGSAERHLVHNGLKKLIKLFDKIYEKNIQISFKKISQVGYSLQESYQFKIKIWKMQRIFNAWQYEAMLCKIQKQRIKNIQIDKEKRSIRLATDFNYFWTIKKCFRFWNGQTKRILKKRQFQLQQQLKRQQQMNKIQQNKNNQIEKQKKLQVQPNLNLQNKLRGFINGLKSEIQGKQRLNTIKQKTQQSRINRDKPEIFEEEQSSQVEKHESQNKQNQNSEQNQAQNDEQPIEQIQQFGPLTNEDLEKRRKQLQKKAKQRKQALQKLKKERQQKKKQEQQQKIALEKQIQQQQKKIRQQQYRKFVKQRKEQEQWKIKQKQLQKQALQFDRLRLIKFYGWIYWIKLKITNQQKAKQINVVLAKIFMRRKLQIFITKVTQIGDQKIKILEQKADKIFCKKLKLRCLIRLKKWKEQQLQFKQQLKIRHQVYTLKIYLKQWLRVRNHIQLENYDWERPRTKRAQCLHMMTLLHKSFQAFKIHRDQQIQNRNIQQHKAKIKQKVHQIVQEKPTINYDDFL